MMTIIIAIVQNQILMRIYSCTVHHFEIQLYHNPFLVSVNMGFELHLMKKQTRFFLIEGSLLCQFWECLLNSLRWLEQNTPILSLGIAYADAYRNKTMDNVDMSITVKRKKKVSGNTFFSKSILLKGTNFHELQFHRLIQLSCQSKRILFIY